MRWISAISVRYANVTLIGLLLSGICALAACSGPPNPPEPAIIRPPCTAPAVATNAGPVCGLAMEAQSATSTEARNIAAYLGISYAESTAGPNRWAPPIPAAKRGTVFNATAFGPICPQKRKPALNRTQSEDCLSLNIWAPVGRGGGDARLPVLVFIHGGAFIFGTSSNPIYDADHLAATGRAIVVTINYRLGALGFLAGIDDLDGNYGFRDQQLALRWVQDNIAGFGGDPGKVTLFGESAGAMSVGLHLVSPTSQNLFRAGIMESNPYGLPYKTPEQARRFGETLRFDLNCARGGLDCMRQRAFTDVVEHQATAMLGLEGILAGFAGHLVWAPVIDGALIPSQPNSTAAAKPAIIGTNLNDGLVFAVPEQLRLIGDATIPKLEYDVLLDVMFPARVARDVRGFDRYRPHDGDNTDAVGHLLTDYLFTCANRHVMKLALGSVYGYQFTHAPSYDVWPEIPVCAPKQHKACHTFELPFVFANPTTASVQPIPPRDQFEPAEVGLSRRIADYWITFAGTLDPNKATLPDWPAFTAKAPVRQILDSTISSRTDLLANCPFWSQVGYDLPGFFEKTPQR